VKGGHQYINSSRDVNSSSSVQAPKVISSTQKNSNSKFDYSSIQALMNNLKMKNALTANQQPPAQQ